MAMTPEAKSQLSKTIRALRTRLLDDFKSSNDSTYKYSIPRIDKADLSEANATRRQRIEHWVAEQVRGEANKKNKRTAGDFRRDIEKQAGYTLLNRMLILRLMEAMGLRRGDLASKGWDSDAYKSFRYFSQEIVQTDEESEGFAFLLQMVFDDLSIDMPGLYGYVGMSDLIPAPTKTLRAIVDAFSDPLLESCWADDMTLGWVYQFWNDPERKILDNKIDNGEKIAEHEIASKTQMFTERYMVDWLLQNSLGPKWLAMCERQGWSPLVRSSNTLEALEERRAIWRAKREAGEVDLTDLMPLHSDLERRWVYYVPQDISNDAVKHAPLTIRELKILDPALGSGHFLVVAFDLLFSLYQEEAEHRGAKNEEQWSDQSIVESILENNLHGIDLDPRAVQIAAAALWIKSKATCAAAHPQRLNLVSSDLGISSLSDNDPALVELRSMIENETGVPERLTHQIIEALRGAHYLGSLLRIDAEIESAIDEYQTEEGNAKQLKFFQDGQIEPQDLPFPKKETARNLLASIESFLGRHTSANELGLRTNGEQLASGVKFMHILKKGSFDVVVANPPYLGASNNGAGQTVGKLYTEGKHDLFAAFIQRSVELCKPHGTCANVVQRAWLFTTDYNLLRDAIFSQCTMASIADVGTNAFTEVKGARVSVCLQVLKRAEKIQGDSTSLGIAQVRGLNTQQIASMLHVQSHRKAFQQHSLVAIPGSPLIHWWSTEAVADYIQSPKVADSSPIRQGLATSSNDRRIRRPWEILSTREVPDETGNRWTRANWVPHIMGASGKCWIEPLDYLVEWSRNGLGLKIFHEIKYSSYTKRIPSEKFYFKRGIAFATIGDNFSARIHRHPGTIDTTGCSIYPEELDSTLCLFNSREARRILADLNPTVHFTNKDVARLPLWKVEQSTEIVQTISQAFSQHEGHREPSVEFVQPGPTSWRVAQEWAQSAVDRSAGEPLPEYLEQHDLASAIDHLSFSVGVALGRFGLEGQGVLDPLGDFGNEALDNGILFLDCSLDEQDDRDSLGHRASTPVHAAWANYGPQIGMQRSLRQWLALDFFKNCHADMYASRPIHWPLSSRKKTFVAWINIHRWNENTLRSLLADHLHGGALPRIDGELEDLRKARESGEKGSDSRFLQVQKWKEELDEFISLVKECAEKGPPPSDDKCPKREVDSRYDPSLDDGVKINSAALWPLLEPQWKDPKKWWKQIALSPPGNKDCDWSSIAMKYFPTRVDGKCQVDPSLAVAHGCFWKYHSAKAWAWELRLQDEIASNFLIQESSYRSDGGDQARRKAYLVDHPLEAIAAIEKEVHRRRKNADGKVLNEMIIHESGLWSLVPEVCWDMETRIIKKQEFGFRLIDPDEEDARKTLLAKTPQKKTGRQCQLNDLGGSADYLAGWDKAVQDS